MEVGVKENFKERQVIEIDRSGGENGSWKKAKRVDAQKVEGQGGEEHRQCDGRIVLREAWNEWESNGNKSNM